MLNRNKQRPERPTHSPSADTSLIARGTVIRGDLRFSGALHLDGRIEGSVLADTAEAVFTLSEHGHIQGEVRVPHAVINGRVEGDIHVTDRLELAPEARIVGDVHYNTLEMAAGAQVNGRITHQTTALLQELPSPRAEQQHEPEPA
ncbi:polymer-forming cytoskeletal protein [Dyella sp.]|uniref:bactofilin family protein n=1 Tax=Dyella sp. TaxID=1869338 RepID=UPI002ED0E991